MKYVPILLLLALSGGAFAAESSTEDPVTYLGEHILAKTDVVLIGEAGKPVLLPTGARIVKITVIEVLQGTETARSVLLVAGAPDLIPPAGVSGVIFLKRIGKGRYEPVGLVDVLGRDSKPRLATLRRYLEIERMANAVAKRKALRDYLLKNLESSISFLRWSAARELANFARHNGRYLETKHLDRIRKARDEKIDPVFRELLDAALAVAGAPDAPLAGTPDRLTGPDGPQYREVRSLLRAWKKGIPKEKDRLDLLRKMTGRWLKHSAPLLIDALDDESAEVRRFAALQLSEGEFAASEPWLRKRLGEERDRKVLAALMHSLGILKSEKALPTILALGKATDLRSAAAFAAARTGGKLAKDWLDNLVATHNRETEKDRQVRKLVTFLRSEAFRKQEKALAEIRQKRLS